ncbi:MAG TPA: DUF5684 domain-containing protein [Planctomycetaceae bacterium]|jgi:hypothetical protein|nr:DUF5684 domain-containing protein [Planctomycetaceae bacterium]
MSIEVTCPSCGATLRLPEKFARRGLVCTKCRHEFRLSTVETATTVEPAPPIPRAAPAPPIAPARPPKPSVAPQPVPTAKREPPRPQTSPVSAVTAVVPRPSQKSPVVRPTKAAVKDSWDLEEAFEGELGALPPRIERREPGKKPKRRPSKKRDENSDWPYYAFGLICFGPLLFIVQPLLIWNAFMGVSAAVNRAQSAAVAQGANANNVFGNAAPGGFAGGGAAAPQAVAGQVPNNEARQPAQQPAASDLAADADEANGAAATNVPVRRKVVAPRANPGPLAAVPPVFPAGTPFNGGRAFPRGSNRAAEMRRQHEERVKATREHAEETKKRILANQADMQQRMADKAAPAIVPGAAPNQIAEPADPVPAAEGDDAKPNRADRRGANPVQLAPDLADNVVPRANALQGANFGPANVDPAAQAAAPTIAGESQNSSPLDSYLSRGSQRILWIVLPLWNLAVIVYLAAGVAATFAKAGRPGWAVIVPIYNVVTLFSIAEVSLWWLLLLFIPGINLLVALFVALRVAEKFGKNSAFGVGLALLGPIFYPVLGFGNARYRPQQTRFASDSY